jgi:hypothetical protein
MNHEFLFLFCSASHTPGPDDISASKTHYGSKSIFFFKKNVVGGE